MVSIRASLTQFYLRNSKYKKIFSGEGGADAAMDKLHNIPAAHPSARFRGKYNITEDNFMGHLVYIIAPLLGASSSGGAASGASSSIGAKSKIETILYFHGGGYVGAISVFHWMFIGNLVDKLGVSVVVPFYPRAPKYDVDANFDMVMPLYDDLIARYDPAKMMIMGDSAGAGLSLALTQQIIASGRPIPAKITLLSPWLDARGNDPRQISIEKNDCILGIVGLQAAGAAYAGKNSITDPRVSPGLASLKGLPPIAMFAGTHDILLTDAQNFKGRTDSSETRVQLDYYEYEKMHHVWMLIPCPEARKCIDQIAEFAQL